MTNITRHTEPVPAVRERTVRIDADDGEWVAYYTPITDRGWFIDGHTFVDSIEYAELLIELLEEVRSEIARGNVTDSNRPSAKYLDRYRY